MSTKLALLIGINYINTPANLLHGCINDIVNMKNMLVSSYNYTSANITMLYDDSANGLQKPLSANLPTRDNMLANLQRIVDASSKCSEIWIHYSGHGTQIRDLNGDEPDGLDEVIVPMDYSVKGFITDDAIFNILKNSKCKTVLIFDSCRSATVCDLEWIFTTNNNMVIRKQNNKKNIANPNVFMFSGCKDNQYSIDAYDPTNDTYSGAMTTAFLKCLQNKKYTCSIIQLYIDICIYLLKNKYSQHPCLSSSGPTPVYSFLKLNPINKSPTMENIINNNIVAVKMVDSLPIYPLPIYPLPIDPLSIDPLTIPPPETYKFNSVSKRKPGKMHLF